MTENDNEAMLRAKLDNYDMFLQKAFDLLKPANRASLVHAIAHCGITPDVKISRIESDADWETFTMMGRKLYMIISKGNLFIAQDSWNQNTGPIAGDSVIYKDTEMQNHIMLAFDISIQHSVLRILYLNARKQTPVLTTLYGYEPFNILDISEEEYQKQKAYSDATAIVYQERYADHIQFLINKSPYQAANAILILQANINLAIQQCIQKILSQGNVLTVDSIIHYSFEPLADATRELLTKYHAQDTTEDEQLKIKKYLALYFSVIEETKNKTMAYIDSMNAKYGIEKEQPINA